MRRCAWLFFAAGLVSAVAGFAAEPVILKGQLQDASGQPVAGARITLIAFGSTHSDSVEMQELQTTNAKSNKKGLFGATSVRSRQYRLRIQAEGFRVLEDIYYPDYTEGGKIFDMGVVELEPVSGGGGPATVAEEESGSRTAPAREVVGRDETGAPPAAEEPVAEAPPPPPDPAAEARAEVHRLERKMDRAADLDGIQEARGELAAAHLRLACLLLATDSEAARAEADTARGLAIANTETKNRSGDLLRALGTPDGPPESVRAAVCGEGD